jgi:hypothetical protein
MSGESWLNRNCIMRVGFLASVGFLCHVVLTVAGAQNIPYSVDILAVPLGLKLSNNVANTAVHLEFSK